MSETRGFDLDGETSRAWSAFTRRLADRLADMSDTETLSLGLGATSDRDEPGMAKVLFVVEPDGMLRRTVFSCDDEVTGQHVTRQRDADQLATETVQLLKESYDILHPAFLSVAGESYEVRLDGESTLASDGARDGGDPVEQLTEPIDSSHLLELAFASITHGLGREPLRDVDGDLVVEFGSTRIYVRVLERTPVIQLFSRLVHNISNPQSAPGVVAALNSDYPFVKFLYADQAVLACVYLPAVPFVPAQLRHMLAVFSQLADELDDELVRRLGGEREIDRREGDAHGDVELPDGVPPELMVLVRMDPEGMGLDPEAAAEVCSYDRALTRQLLHIAVGQEEVWNEAIKESADDPAEEARCAEEAAGWEATRRSLAGALALIDSLEGLST